MENGNSKKTSTGLTENLAALFTYILGFVSGIIFLIIERENKFVKFHAIQSLITFLPLLIIHRIIGILPVIGGILSFLVSVLTFILWIVLMYKAYKGEWFALPIVGDISMKQVNKE